MQKLLLPLLLLLLCACGNDSGNSGDGATTFGPGLRIVTSTLPGGTISVAYGENLLAAGGTELGYTWSLDSGALPPGLTLDGKNLPFTWSAFTTTGTVDLGSVTGGELTEISGVCASRLNPGVLWVHDDSGAAPVFFALDELGNVLQQYSVSIGAQDWEDMCVGPGPDPNKEYLYLADFGDNGASRTNYRIVRVEEPTVPATRGATISVAHEAFYFEYPGSVSRNNETIFADWESGVIYMWTKEGTGGNVYKFPGLMDTAWTSSNPVTLVAVTTGGSAPATLTGGDASRDARHVIVRGYSTTCWEYVRPQGGTFDDIFAQSPATFTVPNGPQHEAICFTYDGASLYTISEKAAAATVPIDRSDAVPGALDTTISGTPISAGVFNFTIKVTDSGGNTATRDFTITIP